MAIIDVLLPVKNGIEFLEEAIESIRSQSFVDWRLLILDHGSTDGSLEMANSYHVRDPRIEVHVFPEAEGLAGLLNLGLDLCDSQYVMRQDADDVSLPGRMQMVLAAFEQNKNCVAIGGQGDLIDGSGAALGDLVMPVGAERVMVASLFRNPIAHPAVMMDRAAIKNLGVRYGVDFLRILPREQSLKVNGLAEDYFMFGQLAILGKCTNIPAKLIKYRWHGGNVSTTRFRDQMEVSLNISRFLVRCFCQMRGLDYFDPAPFCNHGGILFDVDNRRDYTADFKVMETILRRSLAPSVELKRELDFRRVAATRQDLQLLWRYLSFRLQHSAETGEWNAVRSWLIRHFPGKSSLKVAPDNSHLEFAV